jgi:PAS domain S-box-containing protein
MILVWGPELIQVYNDAYIPLIGAKHPRAFGRPTHACWPEIRHLQEPIFARVFRGETVRLTEALYALDRHETGTLDEAYFDATFVPVPLANGTIGGSLSVLFESTDRVRARAAQVEREQLQQAAKAAEQAERENAVQLQVALEAASLGTWDFDLETNTGWHSARTNALFGRGHVAGDVTLDELFACLELRDRARLRAALEAAVSRQGRFEIEGRVLGADGRVRWVAALGHVLPGADVRPNRVVGIAQDVTDRKAADAERERLYQLELSAHASVQRAYEEVAAANRAKSEFLAVMSHELRTPLNAIGGYLELIELGIRGPVTDAQRTDLARIKAAQQHLVGLVTDVLNFVRLEAGRVQYALSDVSLSKTVADVESLLDPQFRAKNIALEVSYFDSRLHVHADREKLAQILVNLLTNALKFTDSGGRVSIECVEGETVVTLRIRDTGIGIAPEKVQLIFEPFAQVDQRLTRRNEGVGLGLAISRDLSRGMGAELTVESTPGIGSSFILTLPRARLESSPMERASCVQKPPIQPSDASGMSDPIGA